MNEKDDGVGRRAFASALFLIFTASGLFQGWIPAAFPAEWQSFVLYGTIAMMGLAGSTFLSGVVRFAYKVLLLGRASRERGTHGGEEWAKRKDLAAAGIVNPKDDTALWVGVFEDEVIRFKNETHSLIVSPAGGGKTVYLVVMQLCTASLPMLVTDMKGELFAITARWRERVLKQKVRVINPHPGTPYGKGDSYNPCDLVIDAVNHEPRDVLVDARGIALQLLPEPANSDVNVHFRAGSRQIMAFTIASLALVAPNECCLPQVQKFITNTPEFLRLCKKMHEFTEEMVAGRDYLRLVFEDVAGMAASLMSANEKTPREFQAFVNGAVQVLGPFAPSGRLAEFTRSSTFRFRDLKQVDAQGRKTTVYVVCDMTRMSQYASMIALFNWAAMIELQRAQQRQQVLILMDEASNFVIADLPKMLTALRGYGISVFMVFQEVAEMARVYGKEAADTMFSQSDLIIGMGIKAIETAERFSRMAGSRTIEAGNYNMGGLVGDEVSEGRSFVKRDLITPSEVRRLEDYEMLVFIKNNRPAIINRVGYHEVEPISGGVDPNPMHGNVAYVGATKVRL